MTFQSCGTSSSCDARSHRPRPVCLGAGPPVEIGAPVGAEPLLRVRRERAKLQHREDFAAAPDTRSAVQDGLARADADRDCDDRRRRREQRQREARDGQVERTKGSRRPAAAWSPRRKPRVALGKRFRVHAAVIIERRPEAGSRVEARRCRAQDRVGDRHVEVDAPGDHVLVVRKLTLRGTRNLCAPLALISPRFLIVVAEALVAR